MAIKENSFFQYEETRALSGYKSAWLVKRSGEEFYSMVGLTESVPYVFGDKETFDFDILQSSTKGKVEGKTSLEAQDIEVLHHRDNAYRFEKLKGKTLDFMVINAEFVGYKFTGTVDYRPNNAEADVNKATVTITPMSASATPIYDARGEVRETLCFKNVIPSTVKTSDAVDFAVKQEVGQLSIDIKTIASGTNEEETATASNYTITEGTSKVTFTASGLYAITVSGGNYASWTTTVYVE